MTENKFSFPTEIVDLPSKGLLYPESHPLATGKIEMKYMTAKEEDILTNQSYISKGIVIDKLLQSLIVTKFDYNDLLLVDKNAIMVAARVLGYGKDYEFTYKGDKCSVDLSKLEPKKIDESLWVNKKNEFEFTLPTTGDVLTFKLLTHGDDKKINEEITGLQKINREVSPELTTRLKHLIIAVNGNGEPKTIRQFVDNNLLARDARVFREYIRSITPEIELTFNYDGPNGVEEDASVPIGLNFFWPDAAV
jgi:hypothetical protein